MREGGAPSDEPVEIRRVDVGVAQRPDRLVALVVGEEEEDVGFVRGVE